MAKEEKDLSRVAGICGIYCGTCPKYLAPRENDMEELQRMAQESSLSVEEIRCDGCLSDHLHRDCIDCKHGFRRCAEEKKVTWCFQCSDFPCQRLEAFKDIHAINGIWHHKKVIDHLQFMKQHGVEEWVKNQDREGACSNCGKMLFWYSRQCPRCHTQVR